MERATDHRQTSLPPSTTPINWAAPLSSPTAISAAHAVNGGHDRRSTSG